MNKEELAIMLYQKMQAEYANYLEQVEKMPPKDIIQQAYGIVTKADILMLFENDYWTDTLTKGQLAVACQLPDPLEWLYQSWLRIESTYMEELGDSMQYFLQSYEKSYGKKTNKDKLTQARQR